MMPYKPEFFHINYFFLKYGGYWPPHEKNTRVYKLYKVYQIVVLSFTLCFSTFSTCKGIIENLSDFSALIEVFNIGITIFVSAAKVIFWLKDNDEIKKIMNALENNEFHYEKTGDFDNDLILKRAKKVGISYTMTLWIFAQLTLAFAYGPACTVSFWYYLNDVPIANVSKFEFLPYRTHIPFEHDTAIKYFFACIVQCLPLHLYMNAFVGLDGLFMNMLNLIGEHMRVLQGAFRSMRARCLKNIKGCALTEDGLYNSEELEERMMFEMKKCIRHLQLLFSCCAAIENLYSYLSLFQALGSLTALCSSLVLVSKTTSR
ncbi:hypothetical protein AMK59_5746 [Oryctes borbonicus]|uniref:Odorant receptor n=1 Tax=Oryctes borbonicus TaxID=1629725 RepID=A0A0T6B2P5_9SCAR|nr:hypothetical protein AMK59_5746 [Oryctes borbonicus]